MQNTRINNRAITKMSGFLDWWYHKVKGNYLTDEQYDRVFNRLTE